MRPTPRRPVHALVLTVVTAALVAVGPAAGAAPVFAQASLSAGGHVFTDISDCVTEDNSSPDVDDLVVAENGPAVTAQRSSTATTTYTPDPSDAITSSSAVLGTARISSVGTDLANIDFDAQASASLAPSAGTSTCWVAPSSYVALGYEFLVTRGGFLTVTTSNRGDITTDLSVRSGSGDMPGEEWGDHHFTADGRGLKIDSTATVYLPPGAYTGYLEASIDVGGATARSVSGTGSVRASFAVAGSQTRATSGKGKRYVTFPATRSCGSHSLNPSITGKGKRAKQIKQVAFLVNDTVVRRLRTPDQGETVVLSVGDEQRGELRALVKLIPTRKGKPGKVVELSAGYAPCS